MISMGKSPNDLIYFRLVKYSNLYNRSMSRCFLNVHEFPSMSRWNVPTNSVLLNSRGGADQHRRTWKEQPDISFANMMIWNMRMSCYFSFKPIPWNRSPRMVLCSYYRRVEPVVFLLKQVDVRSWSLGLYPSHFTWMSNIGYMSWKNMKNTWVSGNFPKKPTQWPLIFLEKAMDFMAFSKARCPQKAGWSWCDPPVWEPQRRAPMMLASRVL